MPGSPSAKTRFALLPGHDEERRLGPGSATQHFVLRRARETRLGRVLINPGHPWAWRCPLYPAPQKRTFELIVSMSALGQQRTSEGCRGRQVPNTGPMLRSKQCSIRSPRRRGRAATAGLSRRERRLLLDSRSTRIPSLAALVDRRASRP